jgi:RNA polymerase sigma-70 factor (ECF subfamily)
MDQDWNAVVEDLGPKLFRYFRARFSREQSSDLTQEALIRLVQKTKDGHFDPARGNLRMYAYGIAHFVAIEAHKLPEWEAAGPDLQVVAHLEEDLMERQRSEQMRRALRKLDPVQVQIVSLMIDEEITLADIGVLLDMPVGTVKSHVHRAKDRLREILLVKESV